MRRNHLCAVLKVNLKTIVMGRVVACGDNCPAMRTVFAHRKAQLRRRAWTVKNQCLSTQLVPSRGRQEAKMAGEMPHIVRDDKTRTVEAAGSREVRTDVLIEANGSA